MTFLIQKITKQEKETIDKRAKEAPQSDKTVCRETELVRGCEAQDWGGARVFCSVADSVASLLQSLASVHCLMFRRVFDRCVVEATKTLRKSARQNSVLIETAHNFSESHAKLITINHQTKLLSFFRRHQEDIYDQTKSGKHRQNFTLYSKKMARKDTSVYPENPDTTRPVTSFGPYYLLPSQP